MKRLTDEEIEQAERVLSGSLTCSGDAYSRLVSDVLSRALDELKMWRGAATIPATEEGVVLAEEEFAKGAVMLPESDDPGPLFEVRRNREGCEHIDDDPCCDGDDEGTDGRNEIVLRCGNSACLMQGPHTLDECYTAEDVELWASEEGE